MGSRARLIGAFGYGVLDGDHAAHDALLASQHRAGLILIPSPVNAALWFAREKTSRKSASAGFGFTALFPFRNAPF
jgi:hypothetical protein